MTALDAGAASVLQVLARHWDPIGLPLDDAAEEYRRYAIRLARVIDGGADAHHVAGYLAKLRQSMGLGPNDAADREVAARLMSAF